MKTGFFSLLRKYKIQLKAFLILFKKRSYMATSHICTWKELQSLIKILFFMFSNSSWAPYCGSREQSEKMNTDWKGPSYMTFPVEKKRACLRPTVKYFHSEFPRIVDIPFYKKCVFLNHLFRCSYKCVTWRKKKERDHPLQEFSWVCMKEQICLRNNFPPIYF